MEIKDQYLELVLAGENPLIFDGAMGSMLQQTGLLKPGDISDVLNLTHPDVVEQVHRAYVDAGAQVIITNTFNANSLNLAKQEGAPTVREVYAAAVERARAANPEYVAGDIGPCGQLLEPYGEFSADEAYDLFAEQVDAACRAGVDLLLVETMFNLEEAELAVRAAADFGNVPVFATMTFTENGRTMYGTTPKQAAEVLQTVGASVVGANCSVGPAQMEAIAREFLEASFVPVMVQPNAGLPTVVNGETTYTMGVGEFVESMRRIVRMGVTCVGSCCGTSPAFTAGIASLF